MPHFNKRRPGMPRRFRHNTATQSSSQPATPQPTLPTTPGSIDLTTAERPDNNQDAHISNFSPPNRGYENNNQRSYCSCQPNINNTNSYRSVPPTVQGSFYPSFRLQGQPTTHNPATEIHEPGYFHHPQLGWVAEEYTDQNPWYNQRPKKPIFSLGRPLPHTVRSRRPKRPKQDVTKDEEQGPDADSQEKLASPSVNESAAPSTMSQSYSSQRPHMTTAAGARHNDKINDAEQPVFEYMPGQVERSDSAQYSTLQQQHTRETAQSHQPEFKIDGEPLGGKRDVEEVEDGEADPNQYRNWWARVRARHPEPLAEFLSTFVAVFMGLSGTLSVNLSSNQEVQYGTYETSCWSWGFAWMFGIYLGGGVSGAHMNPAVSISLSLFRGFPWKNCAVYVIVQFIASIAAGGLAYGCFADSIDYADSRMGDMSASFFSTPREWVSLGSAILNQSVGSAVMLIAIFALGDDQNNPPGAGMHALILGFLLTTLKFTLGYNIGSALNPASDFGPRVIAYAVGYREHEVFGSGWWFYGPWFATMVGSIAGCLLYDSCVFVGSESPVNYRMSDESKERVKKYFRKSSQT